MTGMEEFLYPASKPRHQGPLQVSAQHAIFYDEYGNPGGIPIVYLHGGPGFGASPYFHRFFDPDAFRIITYDQRGAPRSSQPGLTDDNGPAQLVEDNEKLRQHLGIDKWHVYGGSWGSSLSLLYAIKYPERVLSLTLRGVFTMRQSELEWYFSGVRSIMPDAYAHWSRAIPEEERGDLLKAYHRHISSEDPALHQPAAAAFMRYVRQAGGLEGMIDTGPPMPPSLELAIMRIAMHFMRNHYPNEDIWRGIDKIRHIPTHIVQGRYDALTPPISAFELSEKMARCTIDIVTAGHSAVDREIVRGLVAATDRIRYTGSSLRA
jgi:proline iminopeptidase